MNRLRQDFLNQTLLKLANLVEDLRGETSAGNFSENFRREAFRALHTIKGTAQTIGFASQGKLAHELENLFAAASIDAENSSDENYKTLLLEGLQNLKKTFEQIDYEVSASFLESINERISRSKDKTETNFTDIPKSISAQLTNAEKSALAAALRGKKQIFCLEINFNSANFADEFAAFRQSLCEKCEIIATLPAASKAGEIGFQFLIASDADIDDMIAENSAQIVFRFSQRGESSKRLKNIFVQAVAHGEICAKDLGKRVRFEITGEDDAPLSPEIISAIFDALNHLIRNAIDHAIETPLERRAQNKSPVGTIKIDFARRANGFYLTVADDGRGIDAEKVKAAAIEKKLISNGDELTEKETLDFIFLPEFSTRAAVTEISGRGVGLDAVKAIIEKLGGTIDTKSEREKGTTFEIFLPAENF